MKTYRTDEAEGCVECGREGVVVTPVGGFGGTSSNPGAQTASKRIAIRHRAVHMWRLKKERKSMVCIHRSLKEKTKTSIYVAESYFKYQLKVLCIKFKITFLRY